MHAEPLGDLSHLVRTIRHEGLDHRDVLVRELGGAPSPPFIAFKQILRERSWTHPHAGVLAFVLLFGLRRCGYRVQRRPGEAV